MKRLAVAVFAAATLAACSHQAVVPIDNNTLEIDASGPPAWGHAGAMEEALKTAANETLGSGYDKFVVLRHAGCTGQSAGDKAMSLVESADVEIVIRMYHAHEKAQGNAIDARTLLTKPAVQNAKPTAQDAKPAAQSERRRIINKEE